MESTETTETAQIPAIPTIPPLSAVPSPAPEFQQCDACGAPVDHEQRYCVSCGTHRRNVPDPAARYLSQAGARSRAVKRAAARPAARRRGAGFASAVVLALIPVAAAVGIEVGRSANNQDSKLIRELARARSQTVYSSAPTTSSAGSRHATAKTATSHKTAKKGAKSKASATSGGGKVVAKTQNGSVTQLTGAKVTAGQAATGASEAKQVQNSTGKSYVQADNNLPSTVIP